MKTIPIFLSLVFFLLIAGSVIASPLRLEYSVMDLGGGLYDYEFDLILDNNDSTWVSGQGWGWLIFGDAPRGDDSPLTDFVGDTSDLPVGPWTGYSSTGGTHNGPTLGPVTFPDDLWVPSSIGETLSWSGTSTADLAQGDLLFSTIHGINTAARADFDIAYRVSAAPVPEPTTMLLLGSGLLGLVGFRRKFRKE
jgi:hypothetical protein